MKTASKAECVEILSVDLLNLYRPLVEDLKSFTRSLRLELGWHYLLDLAWILARLDLDRDKLILDAGAGTGVLQWYLAQQGATVISVDRTSRSNLPLRFRRQFRVEGLRQPDLLPDSQAFFRGFRRDTQGNGNTGLVKKLTVQGRELASYLLASPSKGCVKIYNQNLSNLEDIGTAEVDAVVAVSALEHNSPQGLQAVVAELMRILKPGGQLLATLVAARDEDTWHEPSQAWCYTDTSLKRIFDLPAAAPSNYGQFDSLFTSLRDCAELRDGLARFYFNSGSKGMPWGKWDPEYQPVGVCRIKTL